MSQLGFQIDNQYFSKQNLFYPNSVLPIVTVWVESFADQRLWAKVFQGKSNFNFQFKMASAYVSSDGKCANGCSRVLKLVRDGEFVLGQNNIVCLDSDYNFLYSFCDSFDGERQDSDHVYWTMVHSKESLYLLPSMLDSAVAHIAGVQPSALQQRAQPIFAELSQLIHSSYVKVSFLCAAGVESGDTYRAQFLSILCAFTKSRPTNQIDFTRDQGWRSLRQELELLNASVLSFIASEMLEEQCQRFSDGLSNVGINSLNIYLFVRGHNLEAALLLIFNSLLSYIHSQYMSAIDAKMISDALKKQQKKEFRASWKRLVDVISSRDPNIDEVPFFDITLARIDKSYPS